MSTADFIASIMMVVGPWLVVIGVFVFIYKNKARWDAEIAELHQESHQKKKPGS